MNMEEHYREAMKLLDGIKDDRGRLRYRKLIERDIVYLWGVYRRWSLSLIGRKVGLSRQSCHKRGLYFRDNPVAIFDCPVMTTGPKVHTCGFCGHTSPVRGRVAEERERLHVARHVVNGIAITFSEHWTGQVKLCQWRVGITRQVAPKRSKVDEGKGGAESDRRA